jgi:hypothetical protein
MDTQDNNKEDHFVFASSQFQTPQVVKDQETYQKVQEIASTPEMAKTIEELTERTNKLEETEHDSTRNEQQTRARKG